MTAVGWGLTILGWIVWSLFVFVVGSSIGYDVRKDEEAMELRDGKGISR